MSLKLNGNTISEKLIKKSDKIYFLFFFYLFFLLIFHGNLNKIHKHLFKMSSEGTTVEAQKVFMRAIDEYIDRHSIPAGPDGPKDLKTLQSIGAHNLYTGNFKILFSFRK